MKKYKNIISILLADDHPVARQGIRSFIEKMPDMKIVGEAEDGEVLKILVAKLKPQILLLDLKMPNLAPAKLEEWVRINFPETITLVLTGHDRDYYLSNMMDAGVAGYLDKNIKAEQLVSCIRRAAKGEVLFDDNQFERAKQWREETKSKWDSLTVREREVLQILVTGTDNNAIASFLHVTIDTVEKHLKNTYKKLGVSSRSEAIIWMQEKGADFVPNNDYGIS